MQNKALLVIFGGLLVLIISVVAALQNLLPSFLVPFIVAVYVISIITMCT